MKKIFWFFALVTLFASVAFAQTTSSSLTGTVAGPDGLIPGATVVVKSNASGTEKTVTTNGEGNFRVPNLDVGAYTVTVTAPGFSTYVANDVAIEVSKDFSLPVKLEVGQVGEIVTITVGEEIVNSVDGEINNNVSRKTLDDLPSLGRNPLNFVPLQAGASSNPSQNTVINGIRTSGTNTTIDGINVQDNFIRSNATDFSPARPTVDEVEQFAVSSQANAGEGFGGAQIQFTTRRGTNDYHGRLFEFNRNSELAANNFFNNSNEIERPFRNRNQFGGSLGGPLPFLNFGQGGPVTVSGRDKLFFFFSYEKLIDIEPADPQFSTTLTNNARQGVFSYTAGCVLVPTQTNPNVCPAGITPGQRITVNLFNPAISGGANGTGITGINPLINSRILSLLPQGNSNQVGDGLNTTGVSIIQNFNQEQTNYATRIDYVLNPTNNITGTFRFVRQELNRADIDNSFNTEPRVIQPSINPLLSVGWTSSFGSRFSNELRGGFFISEPVFLRSDANPANFLGLPLVTNPEVVFQNQGRFVDTYNLQDNATFIAGNHSLRFGGQFQAVKLETFNDAGIVPTFNIGTGTATPSITPMQFTNNALFPGTVPSNQQGTANALLGLLGGIVTGGSQTFNVTSQNSGFVPGATSGRDFNYEIYALHFSDQWRATNSLTLNLGVRYDLYTALKTEDGLFLEPRITDPNNPVPSILDPNGRYQFVGGNVGTPGQFYNTDKNNFSPVLSFAYAPKFGKFLFGDRGVIRGGYRISYINDELVRAPDNALSGNQGLNLTASIGNLNSRIQNIPSLAIATPAFFGDNRSFALNNSVARGFGTVFAVDPNIESPLIQEYSIGITREVGFDTAVEIRYVGTRSSNLIRGIDFNQIDIFSSGFLADFNRARNNLRLTGNPACTVAQNAGCQPLTIIPNFGAGGLLNNGTIQGLIQGGQPAELVAIYASNNLIGNNAGLFRPNPNTGVADLLTNGAEYRYDSVQVDVRRRFSQGFALNANYTFSKNLTNAVGTGQTRFEPFLDNNRPELEFSRADFDQTHKFNLLTSYELPFGKGRAFLNEGALATIFGNFQLGGILQIGSGAPITLTDARGTFNRTGRSGRQTPVSNLTNAQIQDLIGIYRTPNGIFILPPEVLGRNPDGSFINSTATSVGTNPIGNDNEAPFSGQVFFRSAPGQTGNLGRALFNGPTTYDLDLSLIKRFVIRENLKFQLQGDLFNVFNTTNFVPGQFQDINSVNFGRISTALDNRIVQLAFRFEF